jgi:hypothetical protein
MDGGQIFASTASTLSCFIHIPVISVGASGQVRNHWGPLF